MTRPNKSTTQGDTMKWAKPNDGKVNFPDTPVFEKDEFEGTDSDDFNAPLIEQRPGNGCTLTEKHQNTEAADIAEAERRLSNPADRVIPFKPER